jgi:hypothetical protein
MLLVRALSGGGLGVVALAALLLAMPAQGQLFQSRANLSLDAAEIDRGTKSTVTVNLSVGTKPITLRRLSVRVRGREIVDLSYAIPEEKDEKGKQLYPSRTVNVRKEEVIFDKEYTVVAGQELAARSHHKFSGDIELPAHLPPSFKGRNASIRWEASAVTDMPGGFLGVDPSTSWVEIAVK